MRIRDYKNYIVRDSLTVASALKKINLNQSNIVFIVDDNGVLLGSFSDGDFRRWITEGKGFDLEVPIRNLMNKNFRSVLKNQNFSEVSDFFKNGVQIIPVLDERGRIDHLYSRFHNEFAINSRLITETSEPFIIAEIGNNHQGELEIAKRLIDVVAQSGAECVKFQMRTMEKLYGENSGKASQSKDLGTQYTLDLLWQFQLSDDDLFRAFDYSLDCGLIPLCTPWDTSSLEKLECYGLNAYKVASPDYTNFELLKEIVSTGKPLICSTGMSDETEIKLGIEFLENEFADYALLHCNSTYPTPFKDVNLEYINHLKLLSNRIVGYSGHERGFHIPLAAISLGAKIIEKHITFNRNWLGNDHKVSLLPNELCDLVKFAGDIHLAMGESSLQRQITQGEMINRESLAKSIFAKNDIELGKSIQRSDLMIKGPGNGLQPYRLNDLIGLKANRSIKKDTPLFEADIIGRVERKEKYNFGRPFGIPVRYHDYKTLTNGKNIDFVEFHLSYQDLNLNFEEFIIAEQPLEFCVHCPELFDNDHILDLASFDHKYRKQSISNLNKVISLTKDMNSMFPKTKLPTVIVNAGGWDTAGFLSDCVKQEKYELIEDSLGLVDCDGVTIAFQTMPPFPWHFGGQSHHNLFVEAGEINAFCSKNNNIKICLDTSHSMMACKYFGWDFTEFVELVSPYNVHLHIADSVGVDGEGVPFGDGDIDFRQLFAQLDYLNPRTPFIPEVWQGHKNSGEGFWKALNYLDDLTNKPFS